MVLFSWKETKNMLWISNFNIKENRMEEFQSSSKKTRTAWLLREAGDTKILEPEKKP